MFYVGFLFTGRCTYSHHISPLISQQPHHQLLASPISCQPSNAYFQTDVLNTLWAVHRCSLAPPSTTTSGLFTARLLCCFPLLLWSLPARSDFRWPLLRCCWRGLQVFSTGAPGTLLSLHPRLHHLDCISLSPALPRCVHGASRHQFVYGHCH